MQLSRHWHCRRIGSLLGLRVGPPVGKESQNKLTTGGSDTTTVHPGEGGISLVKKTALGEENVSGGLAGNSKKEK